MVSSSSHGGPNPSNLQPQRSRRRPSRPQVFISFRGAEVRDNLAKQLVTTLGFRGVKVFIDTLLPAGVSLQRIFKKIEESKIAVVIFSKRFPDSDWCMEELVKIDERAKEGKLVVIPVFYKVSTSDVKNLQGDFGENFKKLKKEYEDSEPEKVKKWEASVKSIADIKGLPSNNNGILPPLVNQIADAVQVWLNGMPGGKVKPRETKMTIGDVIFLAMVAALLCRLFISPLFFNDAKFFKTRVWLLGFPTVIAILFYINNRKDTPPGTRPTPSTTGPPGHVLLDRSD